MSVQIGRPDIAPIARGRLMLACRLGELPAEVLEPKDRERLVYDFWAAGWSDVEIATRTRMTTYTTGRIRARLGLAAHPARERATA
ncbi:hypothetical protein ACFORH_42740 [Amycolatopsis roodepoortensis]|uniref:Uncharacterized protein n=1 Tax=Amycolatopsis roodepoortensis TaxID=700274 RepID=A0ABR9L4H2_9PSEU|nr:MULTISPECIES: hypothetical protein [Amycolatopsis]MBE1575038.1 hypothetical protein [Amycolatopsis roodepoortensis]GHG97359.1 hypothetical protein GCM10017788_76810 [Amycolatopsis acidiphila]